jgi:hypothetical protein
MLLLFRLRPRQLPDLMRVDSSFTQQSAWSGRDLNCGIRDRRRFKDKAAVLLRTVHAINQHTPIEWPRDLSGPMIPLAFRTRTER